MKAHASESGQMHAQHPGMCRQVTVNAPSLGPERSFKVKQAAANFSLQKYRYGRSFSSSQSEVSEIHKSRTLFCVDINMAAF
jgi:hypothetical protein